MSEDNKKLMNPKRAALILLSERAEKLRAQFINDAKTVNEQIFWGGKTINYFLLRHLYDVDGATDFNTFNQWKEQGATIVKNSKSFVIWGQPLKASFAKVKEEQPSQEDEATAKYKYFPMCYLFSDKQVVFPMLKEVEETERQQRAEVNERVDLEEYF